MPEHWPQVCRVKITFDLLLTICFVSTTTNSMKCVVNWIPLNTHFRFEPCLKVGLGIFDFCAIGRRLISKDSISSPNFSCGCSYVERALWCRDSKRRALGNYFSVRICYEFLISKCGGDWDLGLFTCFVLAFINPLSDGKIRFFLRAKRVFFSQVTFTQWFSFRKYPKSAQT